MTRITPAETTPQLNGIKKVENEGPRVHERNVFSFFFVSRAHSCALFNQDKQSQLGSNQRDEAKSFSKTRF
jgi:hypothetical protein